MSLKRLQYYWRIFWMFRKMRLMALFEQRTDFFFWLTVSTMWSIFNFFFFTLIAGVNNGIGNWSIKEIYLLFSVFTIFDGFTWSWFYANMRKYTTAVFNGDITSLLLKPIDTQFIVMTQDNGFDDIFRISIGITAFVWSLRQLPHQVSFAELLVFFILFFFAMVLLYSLWFIIATCSFWMERLDNINDILPNLRRLWQVPRTVYSGLASTFITVIIPLGLITSIPSEALIGKFSLGWSLYFVGFAIASFCVARWFFVFSMKRYKGVGN